MIAYCGLNCTKCEAYIATQNNDDVLRAKVAQDWSKAYNVPVLPEHINCTGCLADGVKTFYCEQMCEIRKCAKGKEFKTCADCNDYACSKLNEVFKYAPDAKKELDSYRS
ncbi:DUF3795 domain-containing protein [Desulfotruncus alcoholivorax]|uniref:DUF3795 domain-containing protein n=1 Tax=Desulfotruncus alcoholivorax TaxID=265477 RepID=UPI0003FF8950|nr:DUF3795 domain-containing protein [Desulfotruncus alcoholivorax]